MARIGPTSRVYLVAGRRSKTCRKGPKMANATAPKKHLILAFFVVACTLSASSMRAQDYSFKWDGNGLLENCTSLVNAMDSPPVPVTSKEEFQIGWCTGYIQGIASLGVDAGSFGFNFCIPDKVTDTQLARVVVKWLRDNPKILNQRAVILTVMAIHDAYPCRPVPSTKTTQ